MESMGRLFELIGRHRSGVLSAVEDNQQIALAASWKDNSEFAAKIKHFTMFLEWARYPIAVAVSMLTYFVTSGTFADSLLAFSTALVGVNPRILRMATGDSHLSTALIASKRGISVRDAHAVDALAHADVAIFIGKRSLLDQPKRVVDWKTLPEVNAQTLLDALLTVESNVEGAIATAVTDFAKSQNARADTTTEVTPIPGLGVIGATPWGRLIVGSRNLLLKNDVMTGRLEKEATSIEASGRRAIFVSLDDNLVAVFGIEETIVPEAAESITALKHLGIASGITTSAEVLAAESLANRIGIETVFFNAGEEKLERVLKSIDARGDNAVLIGHGSAFEEHLRAATAAIAIGNTEKTQAGFDTESRDVSLVPWLIGRARRANLSILVNLVFGTGVVLCSLGIAASWFSPAVVLLAGSAGAISAAITTFNAPYPLATKIIRQVTAPFAAIRNFTKSKMKRSI
jgi:cation transport ATPase